MGRSSLLLALSLLLAAWPARGAEEIPVGDPPEWRLSGVPKDRPAINGEVLTRYGLTAEKYGKLPPGERDRIASWIHVLEWERIKDERDAALWTRRLFPAPALTLAPPAPPVVHVATAAPNWTPAQQASMARIRADAAFDGSAPKKGPPPAPYFTPHLQLWGGAAPMDGSRPPGLGIRRFSLTSPDGLVLEGGHLGLAGRSPLLAVSPYFNVYKSWKGSNDHVDYSLKGQAGGVYLGARLYHDRVPADDRIDDALSSLRTLPPDLGLSPEQVEGVADQFRFSTDFERQWIFVGSMLGRIGRAYNIYDDGQGGGMDLAWSMMGITRMTQFFPNFLFDQSLGLRMRSQVGPTVALFGGVTEGLGIFNKSVVVDSLNADKLKTNVHPQAAPHLTAAVYGMMPYLSSVRYSVRAGQQWNPWTTVRHVGGGLSSNVRGTDVGVYGRYENESGEDAGYQRKQTAAGLTVSPAPGLGIYGQYSQDKAVLGTAQVDNHAVMFGLTFSETARGQGGRSKGSVTMTSLFGGRDHLVSQERRAAIVQAVQDALRLMRRIKDGALNQGGGATSVWRDIQRAWNSLDPDAKAILEAAYRAVNPKGGSLSDLMKTRPATWESLNDMVDLLADTEVLERLLVRFVRAKILKELEAVDIPLIGEIKLSAPLVIAAAHAYGLGLTPPPAITDKAARAGLDPYIINQVSKQFGCDKGPQPQTATDCILSGLSEKDREAVKAKYGDDINNLLMAAVRWPSDVLQKEMNELLLQVMLAAERLNEMTVDEGRRIGEHNVRGLMDSFRYLDDRTRKANAKVFKLARKHAEEDLAAVDRRMRRSLAEYGAARLKWLHQQPSWPAGIKVQVPESDWAPLLAVYGDKAIFDLILRCKGVLAARPEALAYKNASRSVIIRMDKPSALNSIVTVVGDPAVIKLPPGGADLSRYNPEF